MSSGKRKELQQPQRADLARRPVRIPGIERRGLTGTCFAALICLITVPSAVAGYDTAHIVKHTCAPGGPLIVTDDWKQPKDRDRVITEPGEVIGCPPAGAKDSFQIAAGPERFGPDRSLCIYFSLFNGDGSDSCWETTSITGSEAQVKPTMLIRPDRSPSLWLAGIASDEVARVSTRPAESPPERDVRASGKVTYFALTVDARDVCTDDPIRVLGFDGPGNTVAESTVSANMRLLSAEDRVPYAGSLKRFCASRVREPTTPPAFAGLGVLLLSLFGVSL